MERLTWSQPPSLTHIFTQLPSDLQQLLVLMEESGGELWKELQECKIWGLTGGASWRKLWQGELDAFPWLSRIILGRSSLPTSLPRLRHPVQVLPSFLVQDPVCLPETTPSPAQLLLLDMPAPSLLPPSPPCTQPLAQPSQEGSSTLPSNRYFLTCVVWPQGHGSVAVAAQSSRQTSWPGPSSRWRPEAHSGPGAPVPAVVLCITISRRQGIWHIWEKEKQGRSREVQHSLFCREILKGSGSHLLFFLTPSFLPGHWPYSSIPDQLQQRGASPCSLTINKYVCSNWKGEKDQTWKEIRNSLSLDCWCSHVLPDMGFVWIGVETAHLKKPLFTGLLVMRETVM